MNEKLLSKVNALKEELNNSPEVKKLKELDEKLYQNEDVMKLAYRKDMLSVKFEDAIKHFGENSKEANEAQKELHQAKLELDKNSAVQEYMSQYKIVKEMYQKINEELFNPFN